MDNRFITRLFDWETGVSRSATLANRALRALGRRAWLRAPGSTGYMTNIEVRQNLYHLVSQVLAYDVPGDLIELGTFVGYTGVLIGKVLQAEGDGTRTLHLYDTFTPLWNEPDPRAACERNFRDHGLPLPSMHAGLFHDTLPTQLPAKVSFVHVDCGWGTDADEHGRVIRDAMAEVYPRLSRGAICSLIDYGSREDLPENQNPGVKPAIDAFLADKPEEISVLYAAEYGHAYFRKL
ncbi:MAG: TylF/MycF/NovP-related O-methyltransferase [Polyangiales bacterium]